MADWVDKKIEELGGYVEICSCNKKHEIATRQFVFCSGGITRISAVAADIMPLGKILLITRDTARECGIADRVSDYLKNSGYSIIMHCYGADATASFEQAGQLFGYPEDVRMVVSVGDGAMSALAKYFASIKGLPSVCVPTSCDCGDVIDDVLNMYVGKVVHRIKAACPFAIIYDFDIITDSLHGEIVSAFCDNMSAVTMMFDKYFAASLIGEKYCTKNYNNIDKLLKKNLEIWESLVRDDRQSIIQNLEYTIKLGMIRLMTPEFNYSSALAAAQVFEMLQHAKGRDCIPLGELKMVFAKKLFSVYELLVSKEFVDLSLPVDKGLRADKISEFFELGRYEALKSLDYEYTNADYNLSMLKFREYRPDFTNLLHAFVETVELAYKGYKRISSDLGYATLKSMAVSDIKLAVSMCSDIFTEYTPLTFMRNLGVLDPYLK